MEYIQQYAEDEGNMVIEETDDEENAYDREFIDDNVFVSPDPSFYRTIDNGIKTDQNIDRGYIENNVMSFEDNNERLANLNDQAENYTYRCLKKS